MWIIFLPMFISLALVPMLLLSNDLLTESEQLFAEKVASSMQMQHRAVVDYCTKSHSVCNGNKKINYFLFNHFLTIENREGQLFKTNSGFSSYASNNGELIVTVLSNDRASNKMRLPQSGMIGKYWEAQSVVGAGIYNDKFFTDFNGNQFNITLPDSGRYTTDNNAPILVCDKVSKKPSSC